MRAQRSGLVVTICSTAGIAWAGDFRTQLLSARSTRYAEPSIEDYAERARGTVASWQSMDGQQGGDPAKLAASATTKRESTFAGLL